MLENILIDDPQITFWIDSEDFSEAAKILLKLQINDWELAAKGFRSLKSVQTKNFKFDGYEFKVQYNPGRIISSSAKVDDKSIKERKCFLCDESLPSEQKGILINDEYIILVNPFPIFPEHFTIPHIRHTPQRIENSFSDLLDITKEISKYYTVFYNGPKCGASAPDHLHFQAGSKNFMPIDSEFRYLENEFGNILYEDTNVTLASVDDGLRRFISIESSEKYLIEIEFKKFLEGYKKISNTEVEPMMNILSDYNNEVGWRIIIFLREKHRPSHFFAEEENRIIISPASVDLGGVLITPRQEDFEKISKEIIAEVLEEVTLSREKFNQLKVSLGQNRA
jgi:hypothetical protein